MTMKLGSILLIVGALFVLFTLTYGSQVNYCPKELIRDGSCKDHAHGDDDCYGEFMYGVGSWTMAKNCGCQDLPNNKRSCQCCINCDLGAQKDPVNGTHITCTK